MPLRYDVPPSSGALSQGEILAGIWEHRPLEPPVQLPEDAPIAVESVHHPLVIVVSSACDLEQDFKVRLPTRPGEGHGMSEDELGRHPAIIPHVLFCDVYQEPDIRGRIAGSDIWRRIRGNQDERYHHLQSAPVGDPAREQLPDVYLDFRKTLALPTRRVYEGIQRDAITRVAVVPPLYIHDLIHRFYAFHSRVGLPD